VTLAIAAVSFLLLQADPPIGVEVGHANLDCESLGKGRTCAEESHYLIWLNGKEQKDIGAFQARLKEPATTNSTCHLGESRDPLRRQLNWERPCR